MATPSALKFLTGLGVTNMVNILERDVGIVDDSPFPLSGEALHTVSLERPPKLCFKR